MGHIELAAPVTHIWFAKLVPCWLGILLDLSPKNLESVIYFARYLVISLDEDGIEARAKELIEQGKDEEADRIRGIKRNMLLNEEEHRELSELCGNLFRAGMGAEALLEVLRDLDWNKVQAEGYAFQIELHHTAWKQGYTIKEVPIVFTERREGDSKMSTAISLEAAWRVLRLAAVS